MSPLVDLKLYLAKRKALAAWRLTKRLAGWSRRLPQTPLFIVVPALSLATWGTFDAKEQLERLLHHPEAPHLAAAGPATPSPAAVNLPPGLGPPRDTPFPSPEDAARYPEPHGHVGDPDPTPVATIKPPRPLPNPKPRASTGTGSAAPHHKKRDAPAAGAVRPSAAARHMEFPEDQL